MPLFRPFQTYFLVWEKVRGLYTNDISCFYNVISWLTNLKKLELNELMPPTPNVEKQLEQCQKTFLVVTLAGLPSDLDSMRHQILACSTVPVVDDLFARLLRLAAPPMPSSHPVTLAGSSVLEEQAAFQTENRHGGRHWKQRPRCGCCNKLGHTREECYSLHG